MLRIGPKMKPLFQPHECLTDAEIKAYLAGQLSPDQRFRVENHLLDCPLCDDAVEGYRVMLEIESATVENKSGTKVVSLRPRNIISIAAAISILIAAAFWLNGAMQENGDQDLFAANYSTYQSDLTAVQYRSEQEENDPEEKMHPDLLAAATAYDQQSFEEAEKALQDFLRKEGPNDLVNFHMAMAMLESDKVSESIEVLEKMRDRKSVYYEEASWYLALALIKQRERMKANQVLKDLIDLGKGRYYEKAKNLHSKL